MWCLYSVVQIAFFNFLDNKCISIWFPEVTDFALDIYQALEECIDFFDTQRHSIFDDLLDAGQIVLRLLALHPHVIDHSIQLFNLNFIGSKLLLLLFSLDLQELNLFVVFNSWLVR
jgi:hypothetical protein